MNDDELIGRIAPITDQQAARLVSPQTWRDLADQVMATDAAPAQRRRGRVLRVGGPLVAMAAAATVVGVSLFGTGGGRDDGRGGNTVTGAPQVRLAALSFSTQGGYLVVKVRDPLADPAQYKKEFAAHHMNVSLKVAPVSPSLVGGAVFMDGLNGVKIITARGKCLPGGGSACPVGVKIPLGYRGHGSIMFGRAARPGERYVSTAQADGPGEAMHGLSYRGRTVADVLAMLRKRHVTVPQYRYQGPDGASGPYRHGVPPDQVQPGWYVHGAVPWAKDQVLLSVGPTRRAHLGTPEPVSTPSPR